MLVADKFHVDPVPRLVSGKQGSYAGCERIKAQMLIIGKLIWALVATWLISRGTIRLPSPLRSRATISLAHGLSAGIVLALLAVLHGGVGIDRFEQVALVFAAQVLWWLIDLMRAHPIRSARPR